MGEIRMVKNNTIRAVSLFSGAGGMDVGFENAGVQIVFANEIMKEAAETYKANHPDGLMLNDDINNVMDELDKFQGVDLVFAIPRVRVFQSQAKWILMTNEVN